SEYVFYLKKPTRVSDITDALAPSMPNIFTLRQRNLLCSAEHAVKFVIRDTPAQLPGTFPTTPLEVKPNGPAITSTVTGEADGTPGTVVTNSSLGTKAIPANPLVGRFIGTPGQAEQFKG